MSRGNQVGGATKIVAISSGVDFDDGPCRALLVGTAGTADLIDMEGNTVTGVPLQAGFNPLRVLRVTYSGGSPAANVFALF
jgi:hypothetical protein